ncbi:MAG: LacI family transcriptional regulator [Spirochaetia bacterium]|jgi:LacI family transcriptional regulator|nr:LacI family transcriptional regulator [Spirochaetia bacterium]
MSRQKVTLKDIAQQVGLSTASVSMILSGKKLSRFPQATIDKVRSSATEFGYQSKHGPSVSEESVLIVCPSVYNPYFAMLLQGMEMQAAQLGIRTVVRNTYWNIETEYDVFSFARNSLFSGVIFAMIPQQEKLGMELSKVMPLVAVGDYSDRFQFDTVDINNYEAGRMVARHLLELGHQRIAYISTSLNSYHSARVRRLEGIRDELLKAGIKEKAIVCCKDVDSMTELNHPDVEYETGCFLARQCLEQHPEVTAMVGINDMVAYGIMDAIHAGGFSIPDDYSVCGFDNIFPSKFMSVGLTTVEHHIVQRGQRAMSLIASRIRHMKAYGDAVCDVTRVEYSSKLIVRSSTAVPRES